MTAVELAPDLQDGFIELRGLATRGIVVPPERIHALIAKMASPLYVAATANDVGALARQSEETLKALLTALQQESAAGAGVSAAEIAAIRQISKAVGGLAARTARTGQENLPANLPPLVFEVSDLIDHFLNGSTLTGIQRVQLHLVEAVIASDPEALICSLAWDRWVQIPAGLFQILGRLSRGGARSPMPDWQATAKHLRLLLETASRMRFPRGAVLINLGTSWGAGYMLNVRNAKREFGIRYAPIVHDTIPVLYPEYCVKGTVQSYVGWLADGFEHADLFLVNSNNTRDDLVRVATQRGVTLNPDDVVVTPLDADLRNPVASDDPLPDALAELPFVLFVSTIEPRKNHLALLDAWEQLTAEIGIDATPFLVCVGAPGWKNKAIFKRVESSEDLTRRVIFLEGVTDPALAALYRRCLFTVYPSFYEGWGLPITESLCHGKTPLLSRVASHPEAGGDFADYFEIGSQAGLTAALRRLITDHDYRRGKDRAIAAGFRARTWSDISAQILNAAARFPVTDATSMPPPLTPPAAVRGTYYSLGTNRAARVDPDMISGEVFRLGHGWTKPQDWGCWTKPAGATLSMRAAPGRTQGYFRLRGPDHRPTVVRVEAAAARTELTLQPGQLKWVGLTFDAPADGRLVIHLRDISPLAFRKLYGDPWSDTTFGVAGFYLCNADDIESRLAFLEHGDWDAPDLADGRDD